MAPGTLGFAQDGAVLAGGLFSALTDSLANIAANRLTASGQPVLCHIHVNWVSSPADRYSAVTMT